MSHRRLILTVALALLSSLPLSAADKPSVKVLEKTPPPKEVSPDIAKVLDNRCIQVLDASGKPFVEVWHPAQVPADATEAQLERGLTYRAIAPGTLMGVIRLAKPSSDYRRQKVPAGVYTLRLSVQPMDGDHMGTAPFNEFLLLSRAADDKKPDRIKPAELHGLSALVTEAHPVVHVLFPGKDAGDTPKVLDKGDGHQVLFYLQPVKVGDRKGTIGVGLAIKGASASA